MVIPRPQRNSLGSNLSVAGDAPRIGGAPLNSNVRHMKKTIQWLSWGYTALLICGSLAGLLIGFMSTYGNLAGIGCNFYDALLYGINCRGFVGAQAAQILVGFPLLVFQLSAVLFSSPIGFLFGLMLWLPVFVSLNSLIERLTPRSSGRAANGAPPG